MIRHPLSYPVLALVDSPILSVPEPIPRPSQPQDKEASAYAMYVIPHIPPNIAPWCFHSAFCHPQLYRSSDHPTQPHTRTLHAKLWLVDYQRVVVSEKTSN